MKSVREEKGDQGMSQSHPACVYADRIQEREWILEKLKIMNSKVCDLSMKVNKAEELKRIRDEKEETRKRRANPAWGGGASSKHIKAANDFPGYDYRLGGLAI
jgi:hypothetical protein